MRSKYVDPLHDRKNVYGVYGGENKTLNKAWEKNLTWYKAPLYKNVYKGFKFLIDDPF